MSVRMLSLQFIKHGRLMLRSLWRQPVGQNYFKAYGRRVPKATSRANVTQHVTQSYNILPHTTRSIFRKIFVENILNRVTKYYFKELRHQATRKLFYGDAANIFALIGVGVASGANIFSKEHELESVCFDINDTAKRLQTLWNENEIDISNLLKRDFSIAELDIGPPIAKGCSAVVYAAALKHDNVITHSSGDNEDMATIDRYPFALKMMFNYDIQSNALSILRAMYKETVPSRQRHLNVSAKAWERVMEQQLSTLPAHPNIVCMYSFFCDKVGNFPEGDSLYPTAQPKRINPEGIGRNMSLYLLMKRYELNLRKLLATHKLSERNKILLFAQLLEAVTHINRHGIAHRDLKSDNILIEMNANNKSPLLVLSDFGCCLADRKHGLQLPYNSYDQDKGGNAALMAPEIINKQPGPFTVLNYAKSDLWACGAIAYELFGMSNPFYNGLSNALYKLEDLPPLDSACPKLLQHLIFNILNPNPTRRISPDCAANILQIYLWAPSIWTKGNSLPNNSEILQWLLSLFKRVMCEGGVPHLNQATTLANRLTYKDLDHCYHIDHLLICSFLARARLSRLRGALQWIQSTMET